MSLLNKENATAIINAGILAANAGNFQPWHFDVYSEEIELSMHPKRRIDNDEFQRKAMISLGCALQNMIIKASVFNLKLTYQVTKKNDSELVKIKFSNDKNIHHYHHLLDKVYINRSVYDNDYTFSDAQMRQLQQLSPFPEVNLLLLDKDKAKLFSDFIFTYANPTQVFQCFQSGSVFGAIAARKPFVFEQLIEVGRLFVMLQLWIHEQDLSFQPVGCYMVGVFDKHQITEHKAAQYLKKMFANSQDLQTVIGFRLGKATEFFKPGKRLPVEDVTTWHID